MYRTQVKELKDEVETKDRLVGNISEDYNSIDLERESLITQLQLALTKGESEGLARSIAEENFSDLEKEKTMLELELKEAMSRHKQDLFKRDNKMTTVSSGF